MAQLAGSSAEGKRRQWGVMRRESNQGAVCAVPAETIRAAEPAADNRALRFDKKTLLLCEDDAQSVGAHALYAPRGRGHRTLVADRMKNRLRTA